MDIHIRLNQRSHYIYTYILNYGERGYLQLLHRRADTYQHRRVNRFIFPDLPCRRTDQNSRWAFARDKSDIRKVLYGWSSPRGLQKRSGSENIPVRPQRVSRLTSIGINTLNPRLEDVREELKAITYRANNILDECLASIRGLTKQIMRTSNLVKRQRAHIVVCPYRLVSLYHAYTLNWNWIDNKWKNQTAQSSRESHRREDIWWHRYGILVNTLSNITQANHRNLVNAQIYPTTTGHEVAHETNCQPPMALPIGSYIPISPFCLNLTRI